MPKRIYRKNFLEKLPAGSKLVAKPSRWGNPYTIPEDGDRPTVVGKYRLWIESHPEMIEGARRELRGLDLACYCTLDELCHADILLEIANSGEVTAQVEPIKKKQERREAIARQAVLAGDLMTESGYDRMLIELMSGDYQDWIDESSMREKWIVSLDAAGVTLRQFNSYAWAAVKNGLLVFDKGPGIACGSSGCGELIKPVDFDERVDKFLNPEVKAAKPAKQKPQQAGLFT